MSFYLSNHDVRPTGVEPAEFIEPPSPGDGAAQLAERRLLRARTAGDAIALDSRQPAVRSETRRFSTLRRLWTRRVAWSTDERGGSWPA